MESFDVDETVPGRELEKGGGELRDIQLLPLGCGVQELAERFDSCEECSAAVLFGVELCDRIGDGNPAIALRRKIEGL